MIKLVSADEDAAYNGVKIICYGESGVGKTMQVATLPNPILISAEAGTMSLRKSNIERIFGSGNPEICYNVPVINVRSLDELNQVFGWLKSHEASQFQSVALDSITEMTDLIKKSLLAKYKDARQAYGEMDIIVPAMIRAFRDIQGKHVYMTAVIDRVKDQSGVVMNSLSMSWDKLSKRIPFLTDLVLRLSVTKGDKGELIHYFQTQPDHQNLAKDRSGILNPIEEANIGKIISKIQNSYR